MKFKLTIQSLFPLYVILLVFNINRWNSFDKEYQTFWDTNWYIVVAKVFLLILILISIIFYFALICFKKYGNETHTKIEKCRNINDQSLLFFVTFILPICFSDFTDYHQILCCLITLVMMIILLLKTNLYYQNPILTLIGYNIFEIYTESRTLLVITRDKLKPGGYISKKKISDNVYYAKEKKWKKIFWV